MSTMPTYKPILGPADYDFGGMMTPQSVSYQGWLPSTDNVGGAIPTMTPGIPANVGGGGMFGGMSGMNKAQLALGGLQTIGGLWAAFQSAKLAKKSFNFTKKTTEANMANQIKSYNTALEDKGRSRAVVEGQDAAAAAAYIDKNKLAAYGK